MIDNGDLGPLLSGEKKKCNKKKRKRENGG